MLLDGQEFRLLGVVLGRRDQDEAPVETETFIGKFDRRDLHRRKRLDGIDEELAGPQYQHQVVWTILGIWASLLSGWCTLHRLV